MLAGDSETVLTPGGAEKMTDWAMDGPEPIRADAAERDWGLASHCGRRVQRPVPLGLEQHSIAAASANQLRRAV